MRGGYQPIGKHSYIPFIWYCLVGWILISIAGSMFHFTYQWTHCNWAVGLLVAVNESVFEHVKILVLPVLLFWIIDCIIAIVWFGHHIIKSIIQHIVSAAAAVYSGVLFLVLVHIVVSVGGGYESLWFDISLFVVSAFVSQIAGLWFLGLTYNHDCWTVMFAVALLLAVTCHMLFTDHPPKISTLFEDPRGFYGRPVVCYMLDFPSFKTDPVQENVTSITLA